MIDLICVDDCLLIMIMAIVMMIPPPIAFSIVTSMQGREGTGRWAAIPGSGGPSTGRWTRPPAQEAVLAAAKIGTHKCFVLNANTF